MVEKVPSWIERLLLPRLSEMAGEIKALNARFESLRNEMLPRFETVNARFEAVDARLDSIEKRIPVIEDLAEIKLRLAELERKAASSR